VVLELHTAARSCHDTPPPAVTPLARIDAAAASAACPIGQAVLRMWDRGHGSEEKPFIATLRSEDKAELGQQLMYFADATEAYVIDCPAPGRADYLLIEVMPRNERPQLELVVGNKRVGRGPHPRVAFAGP